MVRIIDQVVSKYNPQSPEVTINRYYVRLYGVLREEFGNPDSVLHPSCYLDASPSRVFDNVTYVDRDERAVDLMRESGLKAVCADIKDYIPTEEHDLLILVRPGHSISKNTEWATQHLKRGGLVLAEKSYGNAESMYEQPSAYELCGGIWDGESDIFDFKSERKPARVFRFDKDKNIYFRGPHYEEDHEVTWLIFRRK